MKKREVGIFIFLVILLIGIIYATLNLSSPWHASQEISNSGGSVFDGSGRAYLCDSLRNPEDVSGASSITSHPLQQFSKNESDLTGIDEGGNGWPDVGLALTSEGGESQNPIGDVFHDIFTIGIDSDGNGWPDKCDCVLSQLNSDLNNCGSCGNVCDAGEICANGVCSTGTWQVVWSESGIGWTGSRACAFAPIECNLRGNCLTPKSCLSVGYYPGEHDGDACEPLGDTICYCNINSAIYAWVEKCQI